MRIPVIYSRGNFLVGVRVHGVAATLAHTVRSLRDLAYSLDGLDAALVSLERAIKVEKAIIAEAQAKARPGSGFNLPENWSVQSKYWRGRALLNAKTGASALHQVRDALCQVKRLSEDAVKEAGDTRPDLAEGVRNCTVVIKAAEAAIRAFDARFPDLEALRHSIAHASERAAWRATVRREKHSVKLSAAETAGGTKLSDLLTSIGDLDGRTLTFRILTDGAGSPGRLDLTDATLDAAKTIVQAFSDALPWDEHGKRELLEFIAPLGPA